MADVFKPCSVEGCNGNAHWSARGRGRKGYCGAHYQRFMIYGDPLGGSPTMHGEPLRFIEEVAVSYDGAECLPWPFSKDDKGYGIMRVDGKTIRAHRYLCMRVHGLPPTPEHEAAHSCGKGHQACTAKNHLFWKTQAENQADRLDHGTHNRGERSGKAKITEKQAREILSLKGTRFQHEIASEYGVSKSTVANIHLRKTWAWLIP